MRGLRSFVLGALAAAWFAVGAPVLAQNNTNNTNNQNNAAVGNLPAGVFVSPEGVLRVSTLKDQTGELTRTRIAESRARLNAAVAKVSPLRKISLQRLEAAVAERLTAGKEPTEEMKALAGLTRVQYVFYYPDTKDIVIAGPAEGYFVDFSGRLLGMNSGRAVVELQDLAAALRAFPPAGRGAHEIAVSIDPTPEGLARMNQWLRSIRPSPGDAPRIAEEMRKQQGMHVVTISGISPRTHFAQVLVEADYRMKLIGIGLEPPPVKMMTYIDRAVPNENMQRWYFTPNYDCVRVADDELAMELVGQGVKLVGASELVGATGKRSDAGNQSRASMAYCQAFTNNYPQIAQRAAVYGQLKNLIDLAMAAAFIQKQDYYSQAGWKMDVLGSEGQYAIETFEAPKTVEPASNAVWKGNRLMLPIGGGVQMEPVRALQAENRLKDEKGTVKQARDSVKLDSLAAGQWWWD